MPIWDRYCIICGQIGSYLDFDPPYGGLTTSAVRAIRTMAVVAPWRD